MAVTKPKSPKFNKTKQRPLQRDYVNETAPKFDQYKTVKHSISAANILAEPVKQPSSTRATDLCSQRRREEIEAWKAKEEKERKDEEARKLKQLRVSLLLLILFRLRDKYKTFVKCKIRMLLRKWIKQLIK